MLSSSSIAGFSVEEAAQQPDGVEHVDHKDPEQHLSDGDPFGAAVRRLRITRREHDSDLKQSINNNKKTSNSPRAS